MSNGEGGHLWMLLPIDARVMQSITFMCASFMWGGVCGVVDSIDSSRSRS